MATPVEAPKLGNTVEEVLVAKWRKRKGDPVSAGEVIAEIETDKATFEVTAPVGGALLETFFEEGALVPVYANLCVIGEPGEEVEAFRPRVAQAAPEGPADLPTRGPGVPTSVDTAGTSAHATLSPRARRFAEEHDFHPSAVSGSGPGGRVLEEDLRRAWFTSARVSPAAGKRIKDGHAGDLPHGSGAGGMILSSDLGPAATAMSGIREKIARRMRESLASTAQYTLHSSADASGLLALRKRAKVRGAEITIGDLVAFCAIQALLEFPDLNAELIDCRLYKRPGIHLGFACDTPRGLMVPVVRDAHKMAVDELSRGMKRLAEEAVNGSIPVDDLAGATFTVSNLGSLGIESFTPLLNPPQVAILGVDAIQVKPVRRRDGGVVFIDSIGLSLTCDHQVIDGAPGARFLQALKGKIENVESLCTI
ncbi:MAG: 2-oxo acid dehydrogenase subunit E2 [Acidobacteriia bacterium]|nr:2-oxo acid dehydrogenase subunit E2 [Terriglobia bacterium]